MDVRNNSKTDEETLWRLNNEIALELAPTTTIFIIYAIIGITGNSISIYIYLCRMKKAIGKRYFIVWLSATDLATCAVTSGFTISMDVLPLTFKGNTICKILWTVASFLAISSALLLVLIAVHRYRLICKPIGKAFNSFWRRFALIATYFIAIILSIPNLAFYGESSDTHPVYNISGSNCGESHGQKYSILFLIFNCVLLVTFAVTVTTLIVLYYLIGKSILARPSNKWRKRKLQITRFENSTETSLQKIPQSKFKDIPNVAKLNYGTDSDEVSLDINTLQQTDEKDRKPLKSRFHRYRHTLMFMLISLIFVISYAPHVIITILKNIYPFLLIDLSIGQYRTYLFFYSLFVVNNIVNPFLYGVFDLEFRTLLRRMLPCKCRQTRQGSGNIVM